MTNISILLHVIFFYRIRGYFPIWTGRGVSSYAVHPGVVRTELGRYMDILKHPMVKYVIFPILQPVVWFLTKDPDQGAQTTVYCAVTNHLQKESGQYYR